MRQTRKLRLGGVKKLIQGDTASRQKGRDSNAGQAAAQASALFSVSICLPGTGEEPPGAQGEHSTVPFASRPCGASSRRPWLNPNVEKKKKKTCWFCHCNSWSWQAHTAHVDFAQCSVLGHGDPTAPHSRCGPSRGERPSRGVEGGWGDVSSFLTTARLGLRAAQAVPGLW